jgi:DNA polymerase type B, organellar and viral
MTFRQMWKDEYGLDPLTRTVTLPAAVMEAFRANYLKEETIPITPYHGYARNGRTSAEEKAAIEILEVEYHVKFDRQVRLGPFIYDGKFRKPGDDRDTIFDYHGCFFHACRKCFPNLKKKEHCFINVDLIHMKDRARKQLVKDAGFHYMALYTHQLHKKYPDEFTLLTHKYLEEDEKIPKINHRKTLSGGRTNATRLYYHCEPDEKIEYYDVNGLYPYVLMSKRYPTCHPTYFMPAPSDDPVEFFLNGTHEWFGLVQCTILPPRQLSIPVLELKVNERLTFPLCNTCVREKSNSLCNHSDEERALSGTWTTNTIHYAIQCGYTLMSIKQIEHYQSSADAENNPFHAFIKRCMEKKKEAQIQNNSSARSLAKLVANAFWGKLATNADRPRLAFVKTDEELLALASDSSIRIYDMVDLGTLLRVTYRTKDDFIKTPPYTSLISAIFVTDYARLELLRYLHAIAEDDLLYFDTDSVIFKQKRNDPLPFTNIGIECGQMASELEPGEEIDCFGSTGPKSYFYSIRKNAKEPEIKVKIKGLSLTKEILKDCFKTDNGMEYLVDFLRKNYTENGEINDPILIPQSQMRPLNTSQVIVREFDKSFGNEYYKRRIVNDFKTLPWGYCAS